MAPGAEAMPAVVAKLQEMGKYIIDGNHTRRLQEAACNMATLQARFDSVTQTCCAPNMDSGGARGWSSCEPAEMAQIGCTHQCATEFVPLWDEVRTLS